jgi:hypothetical protein
MEEQGSDTSGLTWTRRDLLCSTTLSGAISVAGCQDGNETPDNPDRTRTTATPPAIRRRIQRYRTTEFGMRVLAADGAPVEGAKVAVSMQRHDFRFGTAVDARRLLAETSPGDPYRHWLERLFNTGVVEHRNKWKPWENESERALALRASEWLRERGFDLRGHAAMWQRFDQPVVPDDVVEKVQSDDEDRAEYVARRGRNHVADVVDHEFPPSGENSCPVPGVELSLRDHPRLTGLPRFRPEWRALERLREVHAGSRQQRRRHVE